MPTRTSRHKAVVIVTSDTCFKEPQKDESGRFVAHHLMGLDLFSQVLKLIVDDDFDRISNCLKKALEDHPSLLITIGGTGLCPRDVTPEATSALYERHCSGISTALHMTSLRYSPHAALSRLTAGIAKSCLIVNFPGSLKASKDCMSCLIGFLEHALEQVRFDVLAYQETHQKLHRPITRAQTPPNQISSSVNISGDGSVEVRENREFKDAEEPSSSTNLNFSQLTLEERIIVGSLNKTTDGVEYKVYTPQKPANPASSELPQTIKPLKTSSEYPMIDYSQALDILGKFSHELLAERVEVSLSGFHKVHSLVGGVLASDLRTENPMPPYKASTMDGYVLNIPQALRNMLTTISTIQARLVQDLAHFQACQDEPGLASTFFCYQVNTGGRLPDKNFAVIPVEKTGKISSNNLVPIHEAREGVYIRDFGSDLSDDDVITAGTILGPVELSLIMAMGHRSILVYQKPSIGLISTGDELVDFFSTKTVDENVVVDTNSLMLRSLFSLKGYKVTNLGISKDDPKEILLKISDGIKMCDILVITGGASMGSKDHVKDVIVHMGGEIHFGRINLKPGKPVAFSSLILKGRRKFIFSLPGNPVSAYVTSLVLILPFIEFGLRNHFQTNKPLTMNYVGELIIIEIEKLIDGEEPYEFDGRMEFVRAKFSPSGGYVANSCSPQKVTVSLKQQSSRLLSLKDIDCLILIDPSRKGSRFHVGQTYHALRLRNN